jgi:hypothetical protein
VAGVCVALSAAMSNAFGRDWREIELTLSLTMGRIGTICRKAIRTTIVRRTTPTT